VKTQTKDIIERNKEFICKSPKGHFMQSKEWANIKPDWINEIVTVEDENGEIKGSMSLLIRAVPIPLLRYTMMYSPRGPVCDPYDTETLRQLLEKAKVLAKKYRSYVLKMDPDIEITDEKFEKTMLSLGYTVSRDLKNYSGIQPRFVFRLDVKGKTEEEVMMAFHHKTRYNIRLSQRKGVEVKIGSVSDIPMFHKIMVDTGKRDKFIVRGEQYYKNVLTSFGPEHSRLYLAYVDGKCIAGSLAILYGNKCWYLYGASSNEMRNYMPNYLLQWEMIRWSIEAGCDIYDFRGVGGNLDEDNPLYGLYKFKVGFGGKVTEFIGMFDYVFKPFVFVCAEKGVAVFRDTRRSLYNIKNRIKNSKNKNA